MSSIWKRGYCRTYQACMKLGMYFLPWRTPRILEDGADEPGPENVGETSETNGGSETGRSQNSGAILAADMKAQGVRRVLAVMGGNMMKRGLPQPLLRELEQAGIAYEVFDQLTSDPTDTQVEAGVARYKHAEAQGILLFGGGSPMDCGKAVAARIARPNKSVAQLQGVLKIRSRKRVPYLWAVPTTSGTGSEATMAAVITHHETHRKKSINDPSIIPHACLLDPALTCGLPPRITADTGMDALSHAVEAYTNGSYNTSLETELARKAVRLIHDNLLKAYEDGSDLEARRNMQRAAFYAGRAFTRGCVGYVHAIGHTVGGLYGVSHGRAMAVLLPHVMKAYGDAAEKRLGELADLCGIEDGGRGFIRWIEELNRRMEIPASFDCIKPEDIPQMAAWADQEANPLYPVPKIFDREELGEIIGGAMK